MSRTHVERKKATREDRLEGGKEKLRLAQLVLTAWYEGVGIAETARRINKSTNTAWRLRVWLGVQNRRIEPSGKGLGRIVTRRALEGVAP